MKKVMPDSSTLLHNTARVTGLPRSSTVPTTIALGSATPACSASANHLRSSATQPSASQSASRSPLPSFSTDPYSTRILAKCSSSRVATRQRYAPRVFADLLPTGRRSRQPGCENRPMTARTGRLRRGARGRRGLHHRDRRTRQGRRRAAVPRRRHRGSGQPAGHLRRRVGAAGRRQVRPRPAARRAVPAADPQRRRPRRRAGRAGHAGARSGATRRSSTSTTRPPATSSRGRR